MSRRLFFQQVTDSRFIKEEDCLPLLKERIEKIKEQLNIDGIDVSVGEPYLLDWSEEAKKDYEKYKAYYSEENLEKNYPGGIDNIRQIQYRAEFYVTKTTRKVSWNDIYKLVNSVNPVPYSFK